MRYAPVMRSIRNGNHDCRPIDAEAREEAVTKLLVSGIRVRRLGVQQNLPGVLVTRTHMTL
jgi:hypothetical protein